MIQHRLVEFPATRIVVKAARLFGVAQHAWQAVCGAGADSESQKAYTGETTHGAHLRFVCPAHSLTTRPAGVNRARRIALIGFAILLAPGRADADLATWCEVRSGKFEIISDLEERPLWDLLVLLERFDGVAQPYLPGTPGRRSAPLKIVIFSSRKDFLELTGKRKFAGFMQPSLQTNRMLVGPIRGDLVEATLHEYAHYLLRNRLGVSLPAWFDEGMASLLGRTRFVGDEAVIGELREERLASLLRGGPEGDPPTVSLRRVLQTESVESWSQADINDFYDWSWLLVHHLYLGHLKGLPDQRAKLTDHLQRREGSLTSYLGISEARLIRILERYLRGQVPLVQVAAPAAVESPGRGYQCLDEFGRDHELAKAVLAQSPQRARSLLQSHLDTHGQDVDLLVTLSRIAVAEDDDETARTLAERASALDPSSANATINLANVRTKGCLFTLANDCRERWGEADRLYREALRRDPARFDAVLGLGVANLYTGRPGDAVNYFRVAYEQAPWAAVTNYYLGESYRLIGDTRARPYLTNARNWAELEIWRKVAEESLRLLGGATGPGEGPGPELRGEAAPGTAHLTGVGRARRSMVPGAGIEPATF